MSTPYFLYALVCGYLYMWIGCVVRGQSYLSAQFLHKSLVFFFVFFFASSNIYLKGPLGKSLLTTPSIKYTFILRQLIKDRTRDGKCKYKKEVTIVLLHTLGIKCCYSGNWGRADDTEKKKLLAKICSPTQVALGLYLTKRKGLAIKGAKGQFIRFFRSSASHPFRFIYEL